MTESELLAQILLTHSNGASRLFRFNAGMAWQGRVVEHTTDRLVLAYPRAVKLGPEGVSDIVGWSALGKFVAIEAKISPRKPTPAQLRFLDLVCESGGRAGVAYSVEDAARIIRGGC